MLEALVSARGHEVTSVRTGIEAIQSARRTTPEFVLLDLALPGEYDGFEVCRRLRIDPATKYAPVVILSARDDADARNRASQAGATEYRTKPFSPIALLQLIDSSERRALGAHF